MQRVLLLSLALHRRGVQTMATTVDFVKLGHRYGKLANLHDLEGIRDMISPDATIYGNKGPDAIIMGMANFRKTFKQVMWMYPNGFKEVNGAAKGLARVQFDFDRYWMDDKRGVLLSSATEFIDFTDDGQMHHIGLVAPPTEPIESVFPVAHSDL
jgi:hypothetical protein